MGEHEVQVSESFILVQGEYYVDTVGKNEKIITEYIQNQLQEDYISDQITIEEYVDPFTGEKKGK